MALASGLYLMLIPGVYLIEKEGFRWYLILRFLRVQTANRTKTELFDPRRESSWRNEKARLAPPN
jgi:hypothetical protein